MQEKEVVMPDPKEIFSRPYEERWKVTQQTLGRTLDAILSNFTKPDEARISVDIANYVLGYLGVQYGLHHGK